MPVLQVQEQIKHFILPSTEKKEANEQAWVDLDVAPLIAADYEDVPRGASNTQVMGIILARRIKQWNLGDTNGIVLEISKDNILKLPLSDVSFLSGSVDSEEGTPAPLSTEEKKASTSGSQPSDAANQ